MDILDLTNAALQIYRYYPGSSNLCRLTIRYIEDKEDLEKWLELLNKRQWDFVVKMIRGVNAIMYDKQNHTRAITLMALVDVAKAEHYNTLDTLLQNAFSTIQT